MKYIEKLIELILDEKEDAVMDWVLSQPLLDQPEILREYRKLVESLAHHSGDDINEMVEGFDTFGTKIENYQEKILDEKLAEGLCNMAIETQEKTFDKLDEIHEGSKAYIIECITTNAPNAAEMRELALKMIELEKDSGIYNADDWSAIL